MRIDGKEIEVERVEKLQKETKLQDKYEVDVDEQFLKEKKLKEEKLGQMKKEMYDMAGNMVCRKKVET